MDKVQYKLAGDDSGPSPIIWADATILEAMMDPNKGFFFREEWHGKEVIATNQNAVVQDCGYLAFTDNDAATIMSRTTARTTITAGLNNEARNLTAGTSDQSQAVINWPNGGVCVEMDGGMGYMAFEASVALSTITDGDIGVLVGLTEEATAADDFLADEAADIADVDFIGFMVAAGDADSALAMYQTSGGTLTTHATYATALVASTNYRLGIVYEPVKQVCRYYVDGVQQGTDLAIGTSGFPDGEEMAVTFACQAPDGATPTTVYMTINWWQVGQVFVG